MTLELMKQRQKELGYTDEKLATLTKTPKSTFSRRWNSDGLNLPHEFVAACCLVLGLSMDEDRRVPDGDSKMNLDLKENTHEEIMAIFAERLHDKDSQIERLRENNKILGDQVIESHQLFHELNRKNIERIDRLNAESKEREDRKNNIIKAQFRTITILSVIIAVLAVFTIYFIIDAFNGDWGIVRYGDLLEIINDFEANSNTGYYEYNPDGITGLWNT